MKPILRQVDWVRTAFGLFPHPGRRVESFRDDSWEGFRDRSLSESGVREILERLRSDPSGAEPVHRARHRTTFRFEPSPHGTGAVYVKRYRSSELLLRDPKTYLRIRHAEKAFRLAYALMEKGVATAHPVFFLRARGAGLRGETLLATRAVEGSADLRVFIREDYPRMKEGEKNEWIDGLAGYLAGLHRKGVLHGDLASNVLFRPATKEFFLIDLDSLRISGTILPRDRRWQLRTFIARLPELRDDPARVKRFYDAYDRDYS